jgi:hypothetical protein
MSAAEINDFMTDIDGIRHSFTIPRGKLRPDNIQKIRDLAERELFSACSEMVSSTEKPFVQLVTENLMTENLFFDGKVRFVGDACGGFRPHVAAATTQCAFGAELTRQVVGKITNEEGSSKTMELAKVMFDTARQLADACMAEVEGQKAIDGKRNRFIRVQAGLFKWVNETVYQQMLASMKS